MPGDGRMNQILNADFDGFGVPFRNLAESNRPTLPLRIEKTESAFGHLRSLQTLAMIQLPCLRVTWKSRYRASVSSDVIDNPAPAMNRHNCVSLNPVSCAMRYRDLPAVLHNVSDFIGECFVFGHSSHYPRTRVERKYCLLNRQIPKPCCLLCSSTSPRHDIENAVMFQKETASAMP